MSKILHTALVFFGKQQHSLQSRNFFSKETQTVKLALRRKIPSSSWVVLLPGFRKGRDIKAY
jgi:hypothetical protein